MSKCVKLLAFRCRLSAWQLFETCVNAFTTGFMDVLAVRLRSWPSRLQQLGGGVSGSYEHENKEQPTGLVRQKNFSIETHYTEMNYQII